MQMSEFSLDALPDNFERGDAKNAITIPKM